MPNLPIAAHEIGLVELAPPQSDRAVPLLQAHRARHSTREFSTRPIPLEVLSKLLWAGFGINRVETSGRTAPSAHNWQEIEVFAVLADAAYRYDAAAHGLRLPRSGDLRPVTGTSLVERRSTLCMLQISRSCTMRMMSSARSSLQRTRRSSRKTSISSAQARDSRRVVRGLVDRRKLASALGLAIDQRIVLGQTVGYPRS